MYNCDIDEISDVKNAEEILVRGCEEFKMNSCQVVSLPRRRTKRILSFRYLQTRPCNLARLSGNRFYDCRCFQLS